jgi:hypothetical protein
VGLGSEGDDGVGGHAFIEVDIGADGGVFADGGGTAEDGGIGINRDVIGHMRVTFDPLDDVALLVLGEAFGPEGHAVIEFDVAADDAGFTYDYSCAVVDKEV